MHFATRAVQVIFQSYQVLRFMYVQSSCVLAVVKSMASKMILFPIAWPGVPGSTR